MITFNEEKISRLEVISSNGRELIKYDCKVNIGVQDNGRTLKIFIE